MLKSALVSLIAMIACVPSARAYDEDTHFYATYALARYSGIRHEVATQIALSAQWMDESYISDPTSLIFMPITGIKKRRLLHFPSSRIVGQVANSTEMKTIGGVISPIEDLIASVAKSLKIADRLPDLQFMTETVEDHPFASEMLMEGLKRGNLMIAAGGLHTLEDSFAHAGTPAEQGHAAFWHWPDRPFSSVDKYMRMVRAVMRALVTIRGQLPPEALDCSLKLAPVPSSTPNCEMDAPLLADNYAATAAIAKVVSYDVLKDPSYVRLAVTDLIARAVDAKYLKLTKPQIIETVDALPIDGTRDSYSIARTLMFDLITNELEQKTGTVDVKRILTDMGRLPENASEGLIRNYVQSFGVQKLFQSMADDLLRWKVPAPLDDTHRMEIEDDASPIRKKEVEIRVQNMQALIRNLYGLDLEMIPNPTKDDAGFDREILGDRSAETKINVDPKKVWVTFSLSDRQKWDNMIFEYLFPTLTAADLKSVVAQSMRIKAQVLHFSAIKASYDAYVSKREAINSDSNLNFFQKEYELVKIDHAYGFFTQATRFVKATAKFNSTLSGLADVLRPIFPKMLKDLVSTHVIPSPDDFYYRDPGLLKMYRDRGVIKTFLTPNDAWNLPLLIEKARLQRGSRPAQT